VNRIVPQLIRNGRVSRPQIGLQLSDRLSQLIREQRGIGGVAILGVEPDSPAAAAGLRGTRREANGIVPGDVIQKVGETTVNTSEQFYSALEEYKPGDTVHLQINRDGQTLSVPVKLAGAEK
jgi:S1-C subfamily serine protease